MANILNLQQNTAEWFGYRKTRIGASDFAKFCAYKDYSDDLFATNFNRFLYDKRHGITKSSRAMATGHELEPQLLNEFNTEHGVNCCTAVVEYVKNAQIFASLDGFDDIQNIAVEIKTTATDPNDIFKLINYYQYQLLHQMIVANVTQVHLVMQYIKHLAGNGIKVLHKETILIKRTDIAMTDEEHYNLCLEFLALLNNEADTKVIASLDRLAEIKQATQLLDLEAKQITESLKEGLYGDYNVIKVSRSNVNYARYIKDNNITIGDEYRNKSEYLKITNLKTNDE